jgi:hypothetical protein
MDPLYSNRILMLWMEDSRETGAALCGTLWILPEKS